MRNPIVAVLLAGLLPLSASVRAETEQIDLKAFAKKARPAVMLLVVSDANGKEITQAQIDHIVFLLSDERKAGDETGTRIEWCRESGDPIPVASIQSHFQVSRVDQMMRGRLIC